MKACPNDMDTRFWAMLTATGNDTQDVETKTTDFGVRA